MSGLIVWFARGCVFQNTYLLGPVVGHKLQFLDEEKVDGSGDWLECSRQPRLPAEPR